jgi:hypothetical protein
MVMKIETIENEKKQSEWPVPCLVINADGTIVLVTLSLESDPGYYGGTIVKSGNNRRMVGGSVSHMHPKDGWTLYDGKVILSNN